MTKKERENDEIRKWKGLHHKIAEWHGSIKEKNRFLHVTDKAEETRFLYGSFSGLVSFPTFFYIFAVTIYSFTLQQGPLRLTYSKPMTSSKPDRG